MQESEFRYIFMSQSDSDMESQLHMTHTNQFPAYNPTVVAATPDCSVFFYIFRDIWTPVWTCELFQIEYDLHLLWKASFKLLYRM
jgi:hypothetical protein